LEVKRITLYHVVMKPKSPFETSFGRTVERHCVLVKVEERWGEVGWGESPVEDGPWYSYETVATALYVQREFLAPQLLEAGGVESPQGFLKLVERVRGHNMAKAGLEMALWDLKAKLEGKPLYKLLGGVRSRVECGVSVGVIGDREALLKSVEAFLERGYKRVKIKIKPGWDVEPVKAIREAFGDVPLQVDANAAYTLADAPTFEKLDGYGLLMIEQPLHYDDLYDHAALQARLKTPICLDESVKSAYDAKAALALGSCRVINIKPARVGGLSVAKEIHDLAASRNVPVWIGGMLETGVGRGHLVAAATLPNVLYPSDIGESSRYWDEDVVEPPWTLERDGTIEAPSKSGIGVEVLEERVEKFAKQKLSISKP